MAVLYVFPVANTEFVQFNDQNNDYITSIHYSELSFGMDSNANVQFSHRRESAQLFPIQAAPFAEVLNEAGTPYSAVSLDAFVAAFTAALPLSGAAAGGGGGSAPDIATYEVQYDQFSGSQVRVLTVFDPITNAPTRTFTTLAGAPYVPINPSLVIPFDASFTVSNNNLGIDIERKLGNLLTALSVADNSPSTDPQPTQTVSITSITASGSDVPSSTLVDARSIQIIVIAGTFEISGLTFPLTTAGGGVIASFSLEASFGKTLPSLAFNVIDGGTVNIIQLV